MPIYKVPITGPGLVSQDIVRPKAQHLDIDSFDSLGAAARAPFEWDLAWRWTSPESPGHVGQAPTMGLLRNNLSSPFWSEWGGSRSPRVSLFNPAAPADIFAMPGKASGIGNFNLSLIEPWWSANDAVAGGLGVGPQDSYWGVPGAWYEQLQKGDFLSGAEAFAQMTMEAPILMMDRAFAPSAVLLNHAFGISVTSSDQQPSDNRFAFEQDPYYYQWLARASDADLRNQARSLAGHYVSNARTGALEEMLYQEFKRGQQLAMGTAGGNDQVTYRAKKWFERELKSYDSMRTRGFKGTFSDYLAMTEGEKLQNDPLAKTNYWLSTDPLAEALLYVPGGTGLANNILGTGIGIAPVAPRTEQAWMSMLTPDQRKNYLRAGMDMQMVNDFVLGMTTIGIAGGVTGALTGGKAAGGAWNTITNLWNRSLWAQDKIMAVGIGVTMANAAVISFFPDSPIAAVAKEIDNARPVSSSVLGGVLMVTSGFASGTAGFYTAARFTKAYSGKAYTAPHITIAGNRIALPTLGTTENSFFAHFGGSRMESLTEKFAAWAVPGIIRSDISNILFSELHHVLEVAPLQSFELWLRGEATTPYFDNLANGEDKAAFILSHLNRAIQGRQERVVEFLRLYHEAMNPNRIMASGEELLANARTRQLVATLLADVGTAYVREYGFGGEALPKTVPELIAFTRQHWAILDRYDPQGRTSDFDTFAKRLGTKESVNSAEKWMQAARVAQARLYHKTNGTLGEILKTGETTEQGLAVWSQRTLFQQDVYAFLRAFMPEDGSTPDIDAVRAAVARIMATRAGREAYAAYVLGDSRATFDVAKVNRAELARALALVIDALPERRNLPAPDSPGTLNDLHRQIEADGLYTLGFRAKVTLPEEPVSVLQALTEMLSVRELAVKYPEAVTMSDTPPEGYVEIPANVSFRLVDLHQKLDPYMDTSGRTWVKPDPTLVDATGQPVFGPRAQPTGTGPFGRTPRGQPIDPALVASLPEAERILATEGLDYGALDGTPTSTNEADYVATGDVVEGNNTGANYPVLEHSSSLLEYVFKHGRGRASKADGITGAVSQTSTRIWAGIAASKIARYLLGPQVAVEIPFNYQGIEGTLQERFSFAGPEKGYFPIEGGSTNEYDLKGGWWDFAAMSDDAIAFLQRVMVTDWLTAQHDSNNDSLRTAAGPGGEDILVSIDKGQAYAFQQYAAGENRAYASKQQREQGAFDRGDLFDVNSFGNANIVLADQLGHFLDTGGILHWDAIEPTLQAIEAMPDDVYLAALKPVAEARAAESAAGGIQWSTPDEFYAWALDRKHRMRSQFAAAYAKKGMAHRDTPYGPLVLPSSVRGKLTPTAHSRIPLNNEPPKTLGELKASGLDQEMLGYDRFEEPPEAGPSATSLLNPPTRAGVIVLEDFHAISEGAEPSVWVVHPRNNYGGYGGTFAKGRQDAGETLRETAYREASEEMGMGVRLLGFLMDGTNSDGSTTRYYYGERVSGGPEFMERADLGGTTLETEAWKLTLASLSDLRGHGILAYSGPEAVSGKSPRDIEITAELTVLIEQEKLNIRNRLAGQAGDIVDEAAQGSTMDPNTPADMAQRDDRQYGYVNYVKMPGGAIFRSPWLDVQSMSPETINLGNRSLLGRMYDTVFRGYRTDRMTELQRAGMHLRISKFIANARPEQINGFHRDLQYLQMTETIGPRNAAIHPTMQLMAWKGDTSTQVLAIAHKWFGEGPYMGADGVERAIDWPHLVAQSFRQAIKLNLTGGVTSYLKSLGSIGPALTYGTDFIYPLVRFNLSPLFKLGERAESATLNGMNFGLMSSDLPSDMLLSASGMRLGRQTGFEDLQTDQAMASLSGIAYSPESTSPRASTFLYRPLSPKLLADAYAAAHDLGAKSPYSPGVPRSRMPSLAGRPMREADPAIWPDLLPPEVLPYLPRVKDPATGLDMTDENGNYILDLSPETAHAALEHAINAVRDSMIHQLRDLTAEEIGTGWAFLRQLPDEVVESLADAFTFTHATGMDDVQTVLDTFFVHALQEDHIAVGPRDSFGTEPVATFVNASGGTSIRGTRTRSATSSEEHILLYLTYLSGMGDGNWGGGTGLNIILKPQIVREAVTVQRDRISYISGRPQTFLHGTSGLLTPAGVNTLARAYIEKILVKFAIDAKRVNPDGTPYLDPDVTLLDYFTDKMGQTWQTSSPIEASVRGFDFDMIQAIEMAADEKPVWDQFVHDYRDHPRLQKKDADGNVIGSLLDDIEVILVANSEDYSGNPWPGHFNMRDSEKQLFGRMWEQAGLQSVAGLRAGDVGSMVSSVDAIRSYPEEFYVHDRDTLGDVATSMRATAAAAGYRYEFLPGPAEIAQSALQRVGEGIRMAEEEWRNGMMFPDVTTGGQAKDAKTRMEAATAVVPAMREAAERVESAGQAIIAMGEDAVREARDLMHAPKTDTELGRLVWTIKQDLKMLHTAALRWGRPGASLPGTVWKDYIFHGEVRRIDPDGVVEMIPMDRPLYDGDPLLSDYKDEVAVNVAYRDLIHADLSKAVGEDMYGKSAHGSHPLYAMTSQFRQLVGHDFTEALRRVAVDRTGNPNLPLPVVRLRVIGQEDSFSMPNVNDVPAELHISVTDGQGGAYPGLSASDVESLWRSSQAYRDLQAPGLTGLAPRQVLSAVGVTGKVLFMDQADPNGIMLYAANREANQYTVGDYDMSEFVPHGTDEVRFAHAAGRTGVFRMKMVFDNGSPYRKGQSWYDPETSAWFTPKDYEVREVSNGVVMASKYEDYNLPGLSGSRVRRLGEKSRQWVIAAKDDGSHVAVVVSGADLPGRMSERLAAFDATIGYYQRDGALEKPIVFELPTLGWRDAWAEYVRQGRVPQGVLAKYKPDPAGDWVPFDADAMIREYGNPNILPHIGETQASGMEEVHGSPDAIIDALKAEANSQLGAATGEARSRMERVTDYVMNPMPSKDARMSQYTREWLRRYFPDVLEKATTDPATGKSGIITILNDLGVPRADWAEFILYDRYLLDNFLKDQSVESLKALVDHGEKYRKSGVIAYPGMTMKESRRVLDEFTMSPQYNAILDLWRISMRAAEDEAYSAHFFNTRRSSFERSINHPVLGIYPASWAFKMAKQWAAFMYMNHSLQGIYLGAAPAFMLRSILAQQNAMVAAFGGTDLEEAMTGGPFAPMVFAFNLIMPGDWSNLPFPFSRTIRDVLRGKTNLSDLVVNNVTRMGIFRDLRLATETAGGVQEWLQQQLTDDSPESWKKLSAQPANADLYTQQARWTGLDPTRTVLPYSFDYYVKH